MIRVRDPRGFFAGLLFLAIGLGALLIARTYPQGSALRMGPGYFPSLVAMVLAALGLASMVKALAVEGQSVGRLAFKPALLVTAAVGIFAATIDEIGLLAAVVAVVVVACFAARGFRALDAGVIAIVLAAASAGIFVFGLGLPFRLGPG